jgi:hypothetical protein
MQINANARVRLIGFYWTATDAAEIESLLNKLDTMRGLDESGNNMEKAQVSGEIHTGSLTGAQIAAFNARYPYLTITADHVSSTLTYMTYDGSSVVKTVTYLDGVAQDTAPAVPSRAQTAQYTFTGIGWSLEMDSEVADPDYDKNVTADRTVYAAYSRTVRTYTVRFYNETQLLQTSTVEYGGNAVYTGSTPTSEDGDFTGWNPSPNNITENRDCYAVFEIEIVEPDLKYLIYTTDDTNMTMTITGLNTAQIVADGLNVIMIPDTIQGYHVILG